MMKPKKERLKVVHPYAWVWEPFEGDAGFVLRSMFGAKSVYLNGKIMLCCTVGEEPWNGILVCTDRVHHASLCASFPALVSHPVLGKWLYLAEGSPSFERVVLELTKCIRGADPRIGVVPQPKRVVGPRKR